MVIMMVTLLSVNLISCNKDDDEASVDSSIVGTWEESNSIDGVWQWTFNSNGKGSCKVTNERTSYTFIYNFSFDGKKLVVSGVEDGEKYTDHYSVTISSDGKTMEWTDEDFGYRSTLTRK